MLFVYVICYIILYYTYIISFIKRLYLNLLFILEEHFEIRMVAQQCKTEHYFYFGIKIIFTLANEKLAVRIKFANEKHAGADKTSQ